MVFNYSLFFEFLIIFFYSMGFLTLQIFQQKWFIIDDTTKDAKLDKKAGKKWHFWNIPIRLFPTAGFMFAGIFADFTLGLHLIPMSFFILIFGAYYFTIGLNKARGLKSNHAGNTNLDRLMLHDVSVMGAMLVCAGLLVWFFDIINY